MSSRPRNTQPPTDLGQFLRLLHSIYDVTLGRSDWPTVIGQISAASGGHSGLLRLVDCCNASEGFVAAYGYDEHYLKAYREYFVRLDPYREFLAAAPAGSLLASDEFAPLSVRDRTEYWNDYERPQDRTHALGSPLGRERDFLLYLGLSRGRRAGPYDEHTLKFLRNLLPHMLRAVQIQRLLGSAVDTRRLSEAALDQLRIGVVLLDSPNSVSFANTAAVELATEFGITLSDSGISLPGSRFNDRLQRLISETGMSAIAGRRSAGGDLTFPRPGVGLLQLRVFPFLIDREPGLAGRRIRAAVFLMRPGNAWLDAAQLATQFDLTPAESRLAAMLANGKTVAEAATSLGIAMPTARTHLRAIFGKTGTRRQSELTLHLLTSLAGLTMASSQSENCS